MLIRILFQTVVLILALPVFAADAPLVPDAVVQGFLKEYSETEKKLIEKDCKNIRDFCFDGVHKNKKIYVATAGGPGASKTTILETYLKNNPGFVYVDPDQRALKYMMYTYRASLNNYEISKSSSYADLLEKAYAKWRWASNYISRTIVNEAFAQGMPIAHGTTSTDKSIKELYEKLKKKGYTIKFLLCASGDENRVKAIKDRAKSQCFVQSSAEDVVEKGKIFYDSFPIYFEYADEITIYWIDEYRKGWIEVATYSKEKGFKTLHPAIEKLKQAYETYRKEKGDSLPAFETFTQLKKNQ